MRRSEKSSRKRLIETAELFHGVSRQKRLPPRANHDEASEDEHGGDGDGEAHIGKNNADLTRLALRGPL